MYAIIEAGSKQFKVTSGDRIRVDQKVEDGVKSLSFDKVLLVAGAGDAKIGLPMVAGATVTADVLREVKGEKVVSVKYKRRKGFHKKKGHRQQYTEVKITGINV